MVKLVLVVFILLLSFLISVELKFIPIQPKILFKNSWIFIDNFTFIHILFGITAMLGLFLLGVKNKYLFLFFILIGYEIYEYKTIKLEFIDTFWDIVFGMGGGYIIEKFYLK